MTKSLFNVIVEVIFPLHMTSAPSMWPSVCVPLRGKAPAALIRLHMTRPKMFVS